VPWLDPISPHFADGGVFPSESLERSPTLSWSDPGTNVKSFTVLLEDLDAEPPRIHWCVFDLPETARALRGGLGRVLEVDGGKQATNDLGILGYSSPADAPSPGRRFALRVYALTTKLGIPAGAPAAEVVKALSGHVSQLASQVAFFEAPTRHLVSRQEQDRRRAA
jgi:Raf kinase inhibitor-like YbhB/YbcL family protein